MKVRNKLRSYLDLCATVTMAAILFSQVVPTFAQRVVKTAKSTEIIEIKQESLETETTGCLAGAIGFSTGGSTTSETWGNVRTYSGGNVNVRARAWERTKGAGGTWQTAYLGQYGSAGLGVTDRVEGSGDPAHKVDNNGRLNYIVFAFNQPVSVDSIRLESVTNDSDVTVYIGSVANAYTTSPTLSDSLLAGFVTETNTTDLSSSRDANINSGNVVGNVIVVAARVEQENDYFKVANIDKNCPSTTQVTFVKAVETVDNTDGSAQSFGFTGTGVNPSSFLLVDNNVVGADRITFNVAAGTPITVTESLTVGWTLANIVCTGTAAASVDFLNRKVSVTPQSGQSAVCTFTNFQLGASAAKATISGRATLMDSRGIGGAIITLQNLGTGETRSVSTNSFGNYSIGEVEVGNFYMVTITHRRYRFAESSKFVDLTDDLAGFDFSGGF